MVALLSEQIWLSIPQLANMTLCNKKEKGKKKLIWLCSFIVGANMIIDTEQYINVIVDSTTFYSSVILSQLKL